jgi:WhiB family transcriptional regulator, redox-sensing transcriptional regulator
MTAAALPLSGAPTRRGTSEKTGSPPRQRLRFDLESWRNDPPCAQTDPEAFFPERGGSNRYAKGVCLQCPVWMPCLEWALDHDEYFGIWGGFSERERRRLQKEIDGLDRDERRRLLADHRRKQLIKAQVREPAADPICRAV